MSDYNMREHYEKIFESYPDVVDTEIFRQMLGIGAGTAGKILKGNHIQHIHYLEQKYLIPKEWVIDYVMSSHYIHLKRNLKHKV